MECNETLCLDKKERTKIQFGSQTLSLNEFEEMIEKDSYLKNKMKKIEEELKKY